MNNIISCNNNDVYQLLYYGKIPNTVSGTASFSHEGMWHCIGFAYGQFIIVVYTGGHNTPLYISII